MMLLLTIPNLVSAHSKENFRVLGNLSRTLSVDRNEEVKQGSARAISITDLPPRKCIFKVTTMLAQVCYSSSL